MEQWIQNLAKKTQEADSNANALELILTTLWCIWTQRNNVIFEGTHPKPIDMLTIKSFFNKFTLSNEDMSQGVLHNQAELKSQWNSIDNWQILIKTKGGGSKNSEWKGIAYIGKHQSGKIVFAGCQSTRLKDNNIAKATAVYEAAKQFLWDSPT